MNKFELVPTEENLLLSLQEDLIGRNKDLAYFYDLLLAQDTASAIALDGRWGSGKTFFVKQSMLLINALNPMSLIDESKRQIILNTVPFRKNNEAPENYELAVYYDAWENDNDMDPILSIVYEITKQLSINYSFENDINMFKVAGSILKVLSGKNIDEIIKKLQGDNPISQFQEQKNIQEKLKTFFTDLLVERGNRLVVFIDELDRCKPSYAVLLLERIKHYLCDDRISFVYSINLDELQHTIRHYYGSTFNSCRYLDRFFDIRVAIPPADMSKFYKKLGLNSSYILEKVCRRVIDTYNFELREITRYYRQVKTAVYEPTHEGGKWPFLFPDGMGRQFILMYIVPVLIGLNIIDISLYSQFINGKNVQPLLDVYGTFDISERLLIRLLDSDESYRALDNKKVVTVEQKLTTLYNVIFIEEYSGEKYNQYIGELEFNSTSKAYAIRTASMLSDYADYQI